MFPNVRGASTVAVYNRGTPTGAKFPRSCLHWNALVGCGRHIVAKIRTLQRQQLTLPVRPVQIHERRAGISDRARAGALMPVVKVGDPGGPSLACCL